MVEKVFIYKTRAGGGKYWAAYSRVPFRPVFADEEFGHLRIPTLLLIGDKDILNDAQSELRRGKQLIPHVQAECIPNAGHLLILDRPELVTERMLKFLKA